MSDGPVPSAEPATISLVSLEELHGYVPDGYVGLVMATGSTVYEAVQALEERALGLARQSHARHVQARDAAAGQTYAVLGLRIGGGIAASGQPEWVAYGTPARGVPAPATR
jgi:hypothetical protein